MISKRPALPSSGFRVVVRGAGLTDWQVKPRTAA